MREGYDVEGRPIGRPTTRRKKKVFHPTYPMGRYLSQRLHHVCSSLEEIGEFLQHCTYVSDQEQFGRPDYWFAPEQFEITKKGDCEDFALWTWRQLLALGYAARFVVGVSGAYGSGHAWATFEKDGKHYLVEALARRIPKMFPRLSTLTYHPEISVAWDGKKVHYFAHETRSYNPGFREAVALAPLLWEWLMFWITVRIGQIWALLFLPFRLARRLLQGMRKKPGA